MAEDREWQDNVDAPAQRDEGDDVEAHAYKKADEGDEAYAKEEPPDVEGHAYNVDTVDNVD